MTRYTGNGAYCYSNSVYMALRESGAAAAELPEPSFIESVADLEEGLIHALSPAGMAAGGNLT